MHCSEVAWVYDLSRLKLYLLFLVVANTVFFVFLLRKKLSSRKFIKRTFSIPAHKKISGLGAILISGTKLYNITSTETLCPHCRLSPEKKKIFLKLRKRYKLEEIENNFLTFTELTSILHCPECSYKGIFKGER